MTRSVIFRKDSGKPEVVFLKYKTDRSFAGVCVTILGKCQPNLSTINDLVNIVNICTFPLLLAVGNNKAAGPFLVAVI